MKELSSNLITTTLDSILATTVMICLTHTREMECFFTTQLALVHTAMIHIIELQAQFILPQDSLMLFITSVSTLMREVLRFLLHCIVLDPLFLLTLLLLNLVVIAYPLELYHLQVVLV